MRAEVRAVQRVLLTLFGFRARSIAPGFPVDAEDAGSYRGITGGCVAGGIGRT
jgi:hypothetical protein